MVATEAEAVRSAAGSVMLGSVAATEEAARAEEVRAADSGVPGAPPAPDASPGTTWSDGCAARSLALPTRWRLLIPTAAAAGLLPRSPQCFVGVTGAAGPIAAAAALVACGKSAVACEERAAARGGLALAQPAGSISAPARGVSSVGTSSIGWGRGRNSGSNCKSK